MKSLKITIFLIIVFSRSLLLSNEVGKIIQLYGYVERSSIAAGERYKTELGTAVKFGQRLKIGKDSYAEVLLNNGTSIYIKEISSLNFFQVRMKKKDPPTKIKLNYGKIKVTSKKIFNDRSLILTTPTAVLSVADANFSVIAGEFETRVLVYTGKVGAANINPGLRKAFVVFNGEEISIRKNAPPSIPISVPESAKKFWFDYYHITGDKRFIVKTPRNEGIIDWILRKRDF